MLGFWCDPFPDEILYSALARLSDRLGIHGSQLSSLMFANRRTLLAADFPTRLEHLLGQLPPSHGYSVNLLIDQFTMFPLFQPFLTEDRVRTVRDQMRGAGGAHLRGTLGLAALRADMSRPMYFCPECVRRDREAVGTAYWHRSHQVRGVGVCPRHHSILRQVTTVDPFDYLSAESASLAPSYPAIERGEGGYDCRLWLAEEVEWVLRHPGAHFQNIRPNYIAELSTLGLVTVGGRLRIEPLLRFCEETYSAEFLESLGQPLIGAENWLLRILRASSGGNPVQHLLVARLVGRRLRDFRPVQTSATTGTASTPRGETVPTVQNERRAEWLALRLTHPEPGTKRLRQMAPATYMWLYRYDHEWLVANSPPRHRSSSRRARVDWLARDAELCQVVSQVGAQLLSVLPPRQVTLSAIGTRIGHLRLLQTKLSKLPQTRATLCEVCESRDEHRCRRIAWACDQLRGEGTTLTRSRLLNKAGLRASLRSGFVEQWIEACLDSRREDGVHLGQNSR